jgi:hypothetical protein
MSVDQRSSTDTMMFDTYNGTTLTTVMSFSTAGAVSIPGALSKGSGTFDIPHPCKQGYRLRHSFVESPNRGDNIYRFTIDTNETKIIKLPDYFLELNENIDIHISAFEHFGRAYGKIKNNTIEIINEASGIYKVLVIGTRKDPVAKQGWDTLGLEYKASD